MSWYCQAFDMTLLTVVLRLAASAVTVLGPLART
jgi:hypothetical protein